MRISVTRPTSRVAVDNEKVQIIEINMHEISVLFVTEVCAAVINFMIVFQGVGTSRAGLSHRGPHAKICGIPIFRVDVDHGSKSLIMYGGTY